MIWFPVIAAGATIAFAGKILARHLNGQLARYAIVDPPGIRTVARFQLAGDEAETILVAVATELSAGLPGPLEITGDAVRTPPSSPRGRVDVVRMRRDAGACTIELTRAWTGIHFGDEVRALLSRIHDTLRALSPVRELGWFAREDRDFRMPAPLPCDG
ncbi:MAG TPA: hypothetical protein VFQ53_19610 [Kofleriaceae bacterium]|nr:hypothetical protein [Kofleriaceae bacterium]